MACSERTVQKCSALTTRHWERFAPTCRSHRRGVLDARADPGNARASGRSTEPVPPCGTPTVLGERSMQNTLDAGTRLRPCEQKPPQ